MGVTPKLFIHLDSNLPEGPVCILFYFFAPFALFKSEYALISSNFLHLT